MLREKFQRYTKYLLAYCRHMTLKKLVNSVKSEIRFRRNDPHIDGLFPYVLIVEISNACNLKCPLCQKGLGEDVKRTNIMTADQYKKLIGPITQYLYQIFLYNWGEPFLNPDIYDIIAFNSRNNVSSVVSTNFTVPVDGQRLVRSGLEHLVISADGVTQEVYSKYRKGGDITKVFQNLEKVVMARKEVGSSIPFIEWQCLVTRHNENHLSTIRDTALRMGADDVRFINVNFFASSLTKADRDEWLPTDRRYRAFAQDEDVGNGNRLRRPCWWLWRTAVVNVNGGITPCCFYDVPDWGNICDDRFESVWNNDVFQEARERSQNDPAKRNRDLICDRCAVSFIYH